MKEFINYSGMLKDFIIYKSKIDYEDIFNNLSDDIKENLEILTEYYFDYLSEESENTSIISIKIHSVKNIDKIPVIINLYLVKNFRLSIFTNNNVTNKIGINVNLASKDYMCKKQLDSLQNLYLLDCDIENEDNFKNYIYNILFYAHIIVKNFKYHPLLKYLSHIDEIDDLAHIQELHLNLLSEIEECSVCLDPTITKTVCKHVICQSCYCNLAKKICPICRKVIFNDIEDIEYIQFMIS